MINIDKSRTFRSLAIAFSLSAASVAPCIGEPLNPAMVPPDVTLAPPSAYQPSTPVQPASNSTQPAPGQMQNAGQNFTPGQPNPFAMKPVDRMRLQPGASVPGRGSTPEQLQQFQQANPYAGAAGQQTNQQPNQQQLAPTQQATGNDPVMTIQTNKGTIVVRLFKQYAPITVKALTEMVNEGFYNGLTWHRVEPGFVIQGGCPRGDGTGDYIPKGSNQPRYLPLEVSSMVGHNAPGVVAMARKPNDRNSSSCQFYITLSAKKQLDGQYTVVGGVIQGMDTVYCIQRGDKIVAITMQQLKG